MINSESTDGLVLKQ